ncbi:viral A-type inclusion protein [Reticulomyxa filosa]|uniref:Viral A-type inclusion protein n=1 Tax=Reticulomyxa filosa TaxID=46433 RepID=X6P4M5_RETFI|nr:viral A-type inclusion protein [Reticulomyxa filosa]|eukprot:ETO33161.1 viral A-type inclusion protein [Reticulomyxa filosa]
MESKNNQITLSPYVIARRKKRKLSDTVEEASGSDVQTQMHKKVRISNQIFSGSRSRESEDENENKNENEKSNVNFEDKKKNEEINLINIEKMDRKEKRNIIVQISQHCQLSKIIKSQTFSMNWSTVFVHFSAEMKKQDLEEIMNHFNKNIPKGDDEIVTKCTIYQKNYVEQVKHKRQQDVTNTNTNRRVLMKNVDVNETTTNIQQLLNNYGYNVERLERFKGLPVVKLTMGNSEDVNKILKDENLFICYRKTKCELFDPFRSRPRRHFKQCKKCYRINHNAEECMKKKETCKYCGFSNHDSKNCKHKNNPRKYLIRTTREKLGIKVTRKETTIFERNKSKMQNNKIEIKIAHSNNNYNNKNEKVILSRDKQHKDTEVKSWNDRVAVQMEQPKDTQNNLQQTKNFQKNRRSRQRSNKQKQNESQNEIQYIKSELAELRSMFNEFMKVFINNQSQSQSQSRSQSTVANVNANAMSNSQQIDVNNINGFYSKQHKLEQNFKYKQHHICLFQEEFRFNKKDIDYQFQYLYTHHWSETVRTGILCRIDLHSIQRTFSNTPNQFEELGFESCWVEISCPGQKKPIIFCSFYRNIQRHSVMRCCIGIHFIQQFAYSQFTSI